MSVGSAAFFNLTAEGNPRYIYSIGDQVLSTEMRVDESRPEVMTVQQKVVKDKHERVQALGFSYQHNTLYLADTIQDVIYRGSPDSGPAGLWKELTVNTRGVEGVSLPSGSIVSLTVFRRVKPVRGLPGCYGGTCWPQITVCHACCSVSSPTGIAVDWLTYNVYWADKELHHIMVSQINGRYHRILLQDVEEPLGLALDPIRG